MDEPHTEPSEDLYGAHLSTSFIPNATQQRTEQETVHQSIQDLQSGGCSNTLTAINEFTTEGYFSMAFPTGAADFLGQRFQRFNKVTIGNYLLKYDDGRFARHPRFRFFALNTEMRWRALQAYIQQHPGDAQLTVDELGRRGFFQQTMHPVFVAPDNSAQSCHQYGRHPWTTHHLFHTQVQLICNGQNLLISSARKILTLQRVESKLSMTTQLLLIGFSVTEYKSLLKYSTLVC